MRKVCAALCFTAVVGTLNAASLYFQTNLSSDIPGLAANTDPNLKNPWGSSFSPTSPTWVSDQVTNVSTLYNAAGVAQSLIVSVPGGPTGQVFSNITGNFLGPNSVPDTFIFASLSGNILGWNGGLGTTAAQEASGSAGAVFTGLAIGVSGGANFLYAADTAHGAIAVFDSTFAPVSMSFTDPSLPAGYTPYNIQNVNGSLYVEYSFGGSPTGGIVDVFDTGGNFVKRLATTTGLNRPWGVTQAPVTFGSFGGDILVGNFGDGTISAFNPTTGAFLGTISSASGPIVNSGLWSLNFRAPGSGFDPNALFITAGINGQKDGLFAEIQVAPEPSTWAMLALGFGVLGAVGYRGRRAANR
jgi:uncharacterized protein (TIGR03118 family)